MKDVKIKDRNKEIEILRIALNMCELGVSYIQADLIFKVVSKVQRLKGEFSLDDASKLVHDFESEWTKYFDKQQTKLSTIVLISVKGKYCQLYKDGLKDVEVRKSMPRIYNKPGQRIWIYNTETKKVQFECIVEKFEKRPVQKICPFNEGILKTGLKNHELIEYANGRELVLIHFRKINPINKEITLNDLHKMKIRPPQSYAYIQTYPYIIPELFI